MQGLSERAYAAHSGLSRGAVQKARKAGRLVLFADGSINAAASDARRGARPIPTSRYARAAEWVHARMVRAAMMQHRMQTVLPIHEMPEELHYSKPARATQALPR